MRSAPADVAPSDPALGRRNTAVLGAASLLNDVASEMIYPLLPAFLSSALGVRPAVLGLIEGLAETTASLAKLASGVVSDRLGRRKPLVALGYALANLLRPLIGLATAWPQVLGLRFGDRLGKGIRTPARDALLADSVPEHGRGRAFGWLRAMDHAGAIGGPLIAMALISAGLSLRGVFLWALLPGVLATLVLVAFAREVAPGRSAATAGASPARAPLPRGFLAYCAIVALFTLGNSTDAFLLLRAQQLGTPVALLPLLWAFFHVAKAASSVPFGTLSDRVGRRPLLIGGYLLYALVYLGFGLDWGALAPAASWGLFAVYGLHFGLVEATEKAFVADLVPEAVRATAYGAFHLAVGIAALPASVIFGVVWEARGPFAAFALGAAAAALAALLLARLRPPASIGSAPA